MKKSNCSNPTTTSRIFLLRNIKVFYYIPNKHFVEFLSAMLLKKLVKQFIEPAVPSHITQYILPVKNATIYWISIRDFPVNSNICFSREMKLIHIIVAISIFINAQNTNISVNSCYTCQHSCSFTDSFFLKIGCRIPFGSLTLKC